MAIDPATTQAAIDDSIAKAREAQKKFEEMKKNLETAKAKADAAIKAAKKAQKAARDLKARSRKPISNPKGGISAIAAGQMGVLTGLLLAKVEDNVLNMLSKFANECPNQKELKRIIKVRSTLLNHLTSFDKRIKPFTKTAQTLLTVVRIFKVIVKQITSIPTPTVIVPFGDVTGGIGVPIGTITKLSNTLIRVNKIIDRFEGQADSIVSSTSLVLPIIVTLRDALNSVDPLIQQCSLGAGVKEIVEVAQPPENAGSEGVPSEDYLYKGYVLSIGEDPNSPKVAPRRFAKATDATGIVRIVGEPSFSSSTQVLLDELKFKIDNQFL